jgi:hypothetical protein
LKKDPQIENEMKTKRFQIAFVHLLVNRYRLFMENGLDIEPPEVSEGKKDWIQVDSNYVTMFSKEFTISNSPSKLEYVRSSCIQKWIEDNKLGITMTKFCLDLKKYCKLQNYTNVFNTQKKLDGKTTMVWYGINNIPVEEPNHVENIEVMEDYQAREELNKKQESREEVMEDYQAREEVIDAIKSQVQDELEKNRHNEEKKVDEEEEMQSRGTNNSVFQSKKKTHSSYSIESNYNKRQRSQSYEYDDISEVTEMEMDTYDEDFEDGMNM